MTMGPPPQRGRGPAGRESFVVTSEIAVAATGASALEAAFAARLGEVDQFPGFQRLEVWSDERDSGRYLMVSWWDTRQQFLVYMRSEAHRRSHARVLPGPAGPRPVGVQRYRVVAT